METFTGPRDFVENHQYQQQREEALSGLDLTIIDAPIVDIVRHFARLPHCFTLQSCWGHFVHGSQTQPQNLERLHASESSETVEYRLAYIALCIEDSPSGRMLHDDLKALPAIDPEYVQFGSADWFWQRQVNSYVVQVEPARHMMKDTCSVDYQEALHIQEVRDRFFAAIENLLQQHLKRTERR